MEVPGELRTTSRPQSPVHNLLVTYECKQDPPLGGGWSFDESRRITGGRGDSGLILP